jgi:hypothetical protein
LNAAVLADRVILGFELVSGSFDCPPRPPFVPNLFSYQDKGGNHALLARQTMSTPISQRSEPRPEESASQVFTDPNKIIFHSYNEEEDDGVTYAILGTHETTPSILTPSPASESAYFIINEANVESAAHFLKATSMQTVELRGIRTTAGKWAGR